jgi:PAS domain S-box-containing protein
MITLIKEKIKIFYVLIVILLVILMGFFYNNFQKVKSSADWVEHTQQVLLISNEVILDIITTEAGARVYVLTGDESFLKQIFNTLDDIQNDLITLKAITKDNPKQGKRVDAMIKKGLARRLVVLRVINAQKSKTLSEINRNKYIVESLALTTQIREEISNFDKEEFRLLRLRKAETEKINKNSNFLFLILLFSLLFIFAVVVYIIKSQQNKIKFDEKAKETERLYHENQALINLKIQESENHFRSMAELMPEKVTNATPEGHVMFFNQSWQDFTGVSMDVLITEGWWKWIHEDELEEATYRWLKSVASGDDFNMELRMKNRVGDYRWHSSKARAMKDDSGKVKLWVGYNTDIHEQKTYREQLENAVDIRTRELENTNETLMHKVIEVEETRAKLLNEYSRSLIEASHDPLFTISPEGKITDVNIASANVTGVLREDLIGSDFINYFTNAESAKIGYERVFEHGFVVDFPLTIKDHKLTEVLFNGSIYKDDHGNILGAVVVAHDITMQKRIENELNEAKVFAEMATEMAEIAREKAEKATGIAESATEIAENAVKAKQQFLSNMSHEIRTPMNAIIGFTKVVLKTNLTAKQKEYMSAIKMSGDALIVLINDILDLAKVEAGKMTFELTPFKLALSIDAMVNLFESKIQEKNLVLTKKYDKNIPDILIGDSVRLHQIIMNLLSNALKFTLKGKINIEVKMIEETDDSATIHFAISDTGIGIAEDKLEGVFEKFNQATISTSRLYGGTGLGLAIVKELVEGQGGSVVINSEVGVGSTFSFTLTFEKAQEELVLEPEIMELDREISDVKVLVVEDMALNQLLMKTLLDDFGFECDITFNGKLAVEKLELTSENSKLTANEKKAVKPYDVILMDLQMPEMNGYEATTYIRNVIKSDIPIIALTADVTTADVEKCKAVGMNDYISKPVNERLLYSKIMALVKKPVILITSEKEVAKGIKPKTVDLSYLLQRTKSNPKLMAEMISVYLEQTPPLLFAMKQSLNDKDWKLLEKAVHKMLPSFSIMGMSTDFESMARKIQEYAKTQHMTEGINELVNQVHEACLMACEELEIELKKYKIT